ncbi:integrin beta-1-like [Actinia tenebrosa]|uniref:Integrin beta n=1 Tax=Actinia tenebrosa TaxID=6105 RepID=A0A6P8IZR4_ACTTE|nr:integrin beta-1-like [Actinia tenebrosa]XP_031572667.1 integrin beta-1-like [Actinia tenebrosa]
MAMTLLVALLLMFFVEKGLAAECVVSETCGECIRESSECVWCEDLKYFHKEQPARRCDTLENHQMHKCKNIKNPKSGFTANEDKKFDSITNFTPQNLTLRLRKGQPAKFNVSMRTPKNFPVDLYYLMDISGSMLQDMKRITTLGSKIAREMSKITSRFRLGLGTFVDKPLAPFIDTHPALLIHPHQLSDGSLDQTSVPAFGFRNVLPLDLNTSKFEAKVAEQNISGNVDNPEGGMDAFLQVIVCHTDIGWVRKQAARRLVVFTTDAKYHIAGDGLLGGVVVPNDGNCHITNGQYDASTTQDYPSLGLVREKLLENQVVPIFAITKSQKAIYDDVKSFFGEDSFSVAEELNTDGSNIVTLIREAYEKIAKTQTISDNSTEEVTVQYRAICPDGVYENRKVCNNVKIGEVVTFEVSVTSQKCSEDMPDKIHLRTAFGEVDIGLEYICDCECEHRDNKVFKSDHCSSHGTLMCGLCDCDEGWKGRLCSCIAGTEYDQSLCPENNATGQICSGRLRGECFCGECQCKESKTPGEKIYGKNCECSNIDCPRDKDELLCGGPDQGKCDCSKCHCFGNWTGPACDCTKEIDGCLENGVLCSNRGWCECGKCVCNSSLPYIGTYCDDCPSCSGRCAANKACVQCRAFGVGCEGLACDESIKLIIVDEIKPHMGEPCSFKDEDDCTFHFAYQASSDYKLVIYVQRERVCPGEIEAIVVILAVIGAILAIGLALLLIWRLLATIQDRREFAKFQKEKQNAKWDTGENPIFKQATTTFQNPTYGKT